MSDADLLSKARVLFENGWTSQALGECQKAMEAAAGSDPTQLSALLMDIAKSGGNRHELAGHVPLAVGTSTGVVVSTLHFSEDLSPAQKREAFRQGVRYIDVETSSQCNRRCTYCPNSVNDRISGNDFIDDQAFHRIIDNLSEISYRHDVHFAGYNEPLMHKDNLYSRIRIARAKLPHARLIVFTNGDYMDAEALGNLIACGTDAIKISVHPAPGAPYNDNAVIERINKMAAKLQTPIVLRGRNPGVGMHAQLVHPDINISIFQSDYQNYGSNRASTLDGVGLQVKVRTAACLRPIYQFIVGHGGNVMPCCVMVSDDPLNAGHVIGNIRDYDTIFDLYCSPAHIGWRKSLFHGGAKDAPCAKCGDDILAEDMNDTAFFNAAHHFATARPPAMKGINDTNFVTG